MPAIYCILNRANGKFYVGSAVDPRKRWTLHKHRLAKGKHDNPHLQNAWNTHGRDAFSCFVVEDVPSKGLLIEREQHWLDTMRACDLGYNILRIAGSSIGFRHSDESKAKMSAAGKGRPISEEAMAARKGKPIGEEVRAARKGRRLSEEHRRNIGEAQKGKVVSDETRTKMSAAQKGKAHGPETRAKISAVKMGGVASPEHRAKISAALKGVKKSPQAVAKREATKKANRASFASRLADDTPLLLD